MVIYLNPANHRPARITKSDKDFAKGLDFKDNKFRGKIRDIHKIESKNSISISVFGYENKEKHPIYVPKQCCEEKHVDSLLIGKRKKRTYQMILIHDFNNIPIKEFYTIMYDHSLRRGRKHFCRYCLHAFIAEEILKRHIKDCFKINGKQTIKMPKKVDLLNSEILKEK